MLDYRAYRIDRSGRILDRVELLCENDDDALRQAAALAGAHAIELWCRERWLAKFDASAETG
jgi:hypothetical protein